MTYAGTISVTNSQNELIDYISFGSEKAYCEIMGYLRLFRKGHRIEVEFKK